MVCMHPSHSDEGYTGDWTDIGFFMLRQFNTLHWCVKREYAKDKGIHWQNKQVQDGKSLWIKKRCDRFQKWVGRCWCRQRIPSAVAWWTKQKKIGWQCFCIRTTQLVRCYIQREKRHRLNGTRRPKWNTFHESVCICFHAPTDIFSGNSKTTPSRPSPIYSNKPWWFPYTFISGSSSCSSPAAHEAGFKAPCVYGINRSSGLSLRMLIKHDP